MEGNKPNSTFFFIPLRFRDPGSYADLTDRLDRDPLWEGKRDHLRYLMRYVSDKLEDQCRHYVLQEEAFSALSLPPAGTRLHTRTFKEDSGSRAYGFALETVHLYVFETSVCVLALEISFEDPDPLAVSAGIFHLKNVSREPFAPEGQKADRKNGLTFLSLARTLLAGLEEDFGLQYFFYISPGAERASFLTLAETEDLKDRERILYFLRNGYNEGYGYVPWPEKEKEEIFSLTRGAVWGVSAEGAACLISRDSGREDFYQNVLIPNFRSQYLYMYVLLLHQKYVLYMFLTDIGKGRRNDLKTLENYQARFYEFETDFVFSFVSEVPQYQILYERVRQAFALDSMYRDINDPLVTLRREREKEEDRVRDGFLNILTLLTMVSVMTDGVSLIGEILGMFAEGTAFSPVGMLLIHLVQFLYLIGIVLFIRRFRRAEKKGRDKKAGRTEEAETGPAPAGKKEGE